MLSIVQTKTDYYNERSYYLLSLNESAYYNESLKMQENIQERSGAGYIYKKDNMYYVLAFAYLNNTDASKALVQVMENYPRARIIKIKKNKIKRKIKRELKKESKISVLFEKLSDLSYKIYAICEDAEINKNAREVYRKLERLRLEISQMTINNVNISGNFVEILQVCREVVLSYFDKCTTNIYMGGKVVKNLRLLLINICFEDIELRNHLNNL